MKGAVAPAYYTPYKLPPRGARQWRDYLLYPYRSFRAYVYRIYRVFGWRFLLFLCASQLFLKGAAYYMSMSIMLPLLKNVFGVSAYWFQLYMMVTMIPWSIKPVFGLLSDFFLIGGYHKRPWMLSSLVAGVAGSGFLFLSYRTQSSMGVALCFMCVQYQVALFDLMSEATYSAWMRQYPYTGTDVVTLVQGYQHLGGLVAMAFVGSMADAGLFYAMFVIMCVVVAVPAAPTLLGWLPEERYPRGVPQGNASRLGRFLGVYWVERDGGSRWMIIVIAGTGLAAPLAALISTVGDAGYGIVVAVLLTAASLMGAYFVFPPLIFRLALYQVVTLVGTPSIGGALDYFYTSNEECVPGGPHFSFAYYQTYAGLVGTACSFLGAGIYQIALSRMKFRRVFIVTAILKGLIGLSDFFIVTRTNVRLGIPDHVSYIVGEAVMEPVLVMLNYIPGMALLSRACLEGMESSIFAFLAGINNFALMISNMSGAFIFRLAGVRTEVPCNFENLGVLVLVCHFILPLVMGVAPVMLIPDTYQDQKLQPDGTVSQEEKRKENMIREIAMDETDDEFGNNVFMLDDDGGSSIDMELL